MTVKQLIQFLSKCPKKAEVHIDCEKNAIVVLWDEDITCDIKVRAGVTTEDCNVAK